VTVRDGLQLDCAREWRPEIDDQYNTAPFHSAMLQVRQNIEELAETILKSHSRVACLFSGGLDSSLVAAVLLLRAPERVVLFNLGSGFGTTTETYLRARFLSEFKTVSHAVNLPADASLVRSLRATNTISPLPVGSIFSHVFEEIISAAQSHGCDAIATGDGGDEVFLERETVLVDLLARGHRMLVPAAAYFALRNDERITHPLGRALRIRQALWQGNPIQSSNWPEQILFGASLAEEVANAVARADANTRKLWQEGCTLSGIESWRRAASVPEWEPINAAAPTFSVLSPLVDDSVIDAALKLRREDFFPLGLGNHAKRLLRHSALAWLPADIAMHPKIGSADGELLRRMRSEEHDALLDLLSSETARRVGLNIPGSAETPDAPLWRNDRWVRAAALVAWFDQHPPPGSARREAANVTLVNVSAPVEPTPQSLGRRRSTVHVILIAALNIAAQFAPHRGAKQEREKTTHVTAADAEAIRTVLTDLAQRACKVPFVTGSSFAMHRALTWYLRLFGIHAILIQGVRQDQTERRYWIEVSGKNIDVNNSEFPLQRLPAESGQGPPR
jgi:asparagine synthetase B (glutamine-hydrolysing)